MLTAAATWLLERPRASRVRVLGAGAAAALLALVVGERLVPEALVPLLGGVAGCVLFTAAVLTYATVLSERRRERCDLPARVPLGRRRPALVAAAVTWAVLMLVASRFLPTLVVGTANVLVVLTLVWCWRLTPAERIDAILAGQAPLPAPGGEDRPGEPGAAGSSQRPHP